MKKQFGSLATVIGVSLFSLSSFAQNTDKRVNEKTSGENGQPNMISFNGNSNYKSADSKQIFQDQLVLKQNQNFSRIRIEADPAGFTHEKFQLFHEGVKVKFEFPIL